MELALMLIVLNVRVLLPEGHLKRRNVWTSLAVFRLVGGQPVLGRDWRTASWDEVAATASHTHFAQGGDTREFQLLISSIVNTGL